MTYYKTKKAGTRNSGTVTEQLNITPATPEEHPKIPTEYQRNTGETPPEQRNHTKQV